MNTLRKFAKDSIIYSLSGWISRSIGFLLIPVFTRIFSPKDYGILDFIGAVTTFLLFGLQLGLESALTRFYVDSQSENEKKEYFSTVFCTKLLVYVPVIGILFYHSAFISHLMFGEVHYSAIVGWAFVSVLTSSLCNYLILLYRLKFRSAAFSLWSISYLIVSILLTIYFVVFLRTGLVGIYWARVIADSVFIILLGIRNIDYLVHPNLAHLRKMLHFGLPLIPTAIAYYLMGYLDRYFIRVFADLSSLGLYAIAYRLATLLTFVSAGFNIAWGPFLYSVYREDAAPEIIKKVFQAYSLGLALLSFGIGLFAKEFLSIFTTPEFVHAFGVAYVLCTATTIYLATDYFCIGIGIRKKNQHRMWAGIIASATNFFLNWLLVPRYGISGAAWATLISYSIYGTYVMLISQRLYPVEYSLGKYAAILAVYLLVTSQSISISGSSLFALTVKSVIFVFIGLGVPLLLRYVDLRDILRLSWGTGSLSRT